MDARFNYHENRLTLYHLPHPSEEFSVAERLSHEFLHAFLCQRGEQRAARSIDLIGKRAGHPTRVGGIWPPQGRDSSPFPSLQASPLRRPGHYPAYPPNGGRWSTWDAVG